MKRHGLTLVEVLVVAGFLVVILLTVATISLQAGTIFSRTSAHVEPQNTQMLAITRIENDLREAMLINTGTTTSSWTEVVLPEKDAATGLNVIVENPTTHQLGLVQGLDVGIFLGTKQYPNAGDTQHWLAVPDPEGDTVFRVDDSIVVSNGKYVNAPIIIEGILSHPSLPDANDSSKLVPTPLFTFWPNNDNGTPNDLTDDTPTVNTRLVKITVVKRITEQTTFGQIQSNQVLSTQFCLRNLQTSQSP